MTSSAKAPMNRKVKAHKPKGPVYFQGGGRWKVDHWLGSVSNQARSQKKRRRTEKNRLSNLRGRKGRVR